MVLLPNVARAFEYLTTTPVSPAYFPYLWAPTLHAARVSIVFQYNARMNHSKQSWGTYITGYLIMAWGGSIISHVLLSLPPPQLYAFQPYINYLGVHLFLTAFFQVFPSFLNPRLFDTFLFPLDAILRVNSITATVSMLSPSSPTSSLINPLLASSPLTHCILGAVASAGGGQSAATLGTWTSSWGMSTPAFLRGNRNEGVNGWVGGVVDTVDVWGGALIAVIYDVLTAHPSFSHLPIVHSLLDSVGLEKSRVFSPLGAKAVCCVILSGLFGVRVFWVHWRGVPVAVQGGTGKKGNKTKVQ